MGVPALIAVLGTLPFAIVPLAHVSAFGMRDARFAAGFTLAGTLAWIAGSVCGLLWGIVVSHPIPIVASVSPLELTLGCATLGGAIGVLAMCSIPWRQRRARRSLARIPGAVADGSIEAIWPRVRDELTRSRTPWYVAPELGPAARSLVHAGHHSLALELFELASSRPGRAIDPMLGYAAALAWASCGEPARARSTLALFAGADPAHTEAHDVATAAVDVAEGRIEAARARIPARPPAWIATTWRLVEASCHALEDERERARDVLSTLELADVRVVAAGALPAAPIARELLSHPPPYRS